MEKIKLLCFSFKTLRPCDSSACHKGKGHEVTAPTLACGEEFLSGHLEEKGGGGEGAESGTERRWKMGTGWTLISLQHGGQSRGVTVREQGWGWGRRCHYPVSLQQEGESQCSVGRRLCFSDCHTSCSVSLLFHPGLTAPCWFETLRLWWRRVTKCLKGYRGLWRPLFGSCLVLQVLNWLLNPSLTFGAFLKFK